MAGTSNQEQQIEVSKRKRSVYELPERLEGWQIIKRLRRNNKTTDKVSQKPNEIFYQFFICIYFFVLILCPFLLILFIYLYYL